MTIVLSFYSLKTAQVNGVRWHQCTYCTKEFKKPSDLVRHSRIHTHEKPYKCNQCFRSFAVKSTLTAHLKTHTGVKEYKCDWCSKMFSTLGSLRVHSRLHTGMLILVYFVYACPIPSVCQSLHTCMHAYIDVCVYSLMAFHSIPKKAINDYCSCKMQHCICMRLLYQQSALSTFIYVTEFLLAVPSHVTEHWIIVSLAINCMT